MTKTEALSKAMKLCSVKEYAASELVEKLETWGILDEDRLAIIKQLREDKFLDEYRMARFYVNDKLRFNKWGRVKIRYMLQQKKVEKEAITLAMNTIDEALYVSILNEELKKKRKTIKDTDPYIIKAKLFQFATGRGFESDLIYKNMDQFV